MPDASLPDWAKLGFFGVDMGFEDTFGLRGWLFMLAKANFLSVWNDTYDLLEECEGVRPKDDSSPGEEFPACAVVCC